MKARAASRFRSTVIGLAALFAVLLLGTLGYVVVEGWSAFDAFYMTVITLATIGYGETHPLSTAGRVLTVALIMVGVLVVGYTLSALGRLLFEEWFGEVVWRSRMKREIARLRGHVVVCGCGRVGRLVVRELAAGEHPLVVVERDAATVERLVAEGTLAIAGDATDQDVLEEAGIARAAGVVTALPDDASNLYVTMSVRAVRADVPVIARASDEPAVAHLRRAGATRVISPNAIGAREMAQSILKPDVLDFVNVATGRDDLTLQLEEVHVAAGSALARREAKVGEMRDLHQVSVVAQRRKDGPMFDMPSSESRIVEGDTLIVVGRAESCRAVSTMAR